MKQHELSHGPDINGHALSRRDLFKRGAAGGLLAAAIQARAQTGGQDALAPIAQSGPASKYTPKLCAAFVRREGPYGMRWPGAVFDGEAALKKYAAEMQNTAKTLEVSLDLRSTPIYSEAEGKAWIADAEAAKADGLILVLLDRQDHAWPTATLAVNSSLPAVIFAPLGTAFTTNTRKIANTPGGLFCCSDDFSEAALGMRMLAAGAKLREMRYIVLKGTDRKDTEIADFGVRLRYVPADTFVQKYRAMADSDEIAALADRYIKHAESVKGPTVEDVRHGVKSLLVARQILQEEEGDAITMDCLGALGKTDISLPCISWSHMLDLGIPAACEADHTACVTHALSQYLLGRPGFQQDPVPETKHGWLIGAHCTCPTRLDGFNQPAAPYRIQPHHGMRDATPVPQWETGRRVTVFDVKLRTDAEVAPEVYISTGEVVGMNAVPPCGGCVVSVNLKLDGDPDLLNFPGFHQLFVYGDFKKELTGYCRLFGITPVVV